jgi:hypothetical protein
LQLAPLSEGEQLVALLHDLFHRRSTVLIRRATCKTSSSRPFPEHRGQRIGSQLIKAAFHHTYRVVRGVEALFSNPSDHIRRCSSPLLMMQISLEEIPFVIEQNSVPRRYAAFEGTLIP